MSLRLPWDTLSDEGERRLGQRFEQMAQAALAEGRPQLSPFLDEDERRVVQLLFSARDDVSVRFYGGYRQARRRRAMVTPALFFSPEPPRIVQVLWVRKAGEAVSVDDVTRFLGSLGLEPGDVGDVLASEEGGWHAIVAAEQAEAAQGRFAASGAVDGGWKVEPIETERLAAPPESVKNVHSTVASLRLDAVAATGFGTSRSRMAADIKGGRVRVNWEAVTNPARLVRPGDVIAIPGRGRVTVESTGSPTKKGRIPLVLKRVR